MGEFFSRIYSALSGGILGTSISVFDIIDIIIITVISGFISKKRSVKKWIF